MSKTTDSSSTGRRRLGRGLGSLIATPAKVDAFPPEAVEAAESPSSHPRALPLDSIRPNPKQPRKEFDERALEALASSVKAAGVMQPVVVRPLGSGAFELVAGERRWRAARRAGLEQIPVIVREADDRQAAEWSLIENLQREDLNPIERAVAFRRLVDEFELKHQEIGELVGMDRSTVTNHLRLLELEPEIQDVVRMGLLTMAHGRALLGVGDPSLRRSLAVRAAREGWSLRTLEAEVSRAEPGTRSTRPEPRIPSGARAQHAFLEKRIGEQLGTRVQIRPGKKKGSGALVISFFDPAQFEGLVARLGVTLEE